MTYLRKITYVSLLILLLFSLGAGAAYGQGSIVYNRLDAQGNYQVWLRNPDGDNVRVPVTRATAVPVWSKDGQMLGISGPARDFVYSWNLFTFVPATGEFQQVTPFEDQVTPDGSLVVYALYKAFSPEGGRVAVSSLYHTITTSGTSTAPILQVFGLDGTPGPFVAIASSTSALQGYGVDWVPGQELLVYPYDYSTYAEGTGLPTSTTALYGVAPIDGAFDVGQYYRITTPRASQDPSTLLWVWEQDFQPAVSPNGQQVAYVRWINGIGPSGPIFGLPAIHIVNLNGTGDREVVHFNQGQFISGVSWSSDGTRLVFDLGRQASSGGYPLPLADGTTSAMYMINVNGTGLTQIQGAPALFPSWNPAGLVFQ